MPSQSAGAARVVPAGAWGTLAVWASTWATVMACLPWAATSGQYSATGVVSAGRPRSASTCTTVETDPLPVEQLLNSVVG
jgi:hypothetical protein